MNTIEGEEKEEAFFIPKGVYSPLSHWKHSIRDMTILQENVTQKENIYM